MRVVMVGVRFLDRYSARNPSRDIRITVGWKELSLAIMKSSYPILTHEMMSNVNPMSISISPANFHLFFLYKSVSNSWISYLFNAIE